MPKPIRDLAVLSGRVALARSASYIAGSGRRAPVFVSQKGIWIFVLLSSYPSVEHSEHHTLLTRFLLRMLEGFGVDSGGRSGPFGRCSEGKVLMTEKSTRRTGVIDDDGAAFVGRPKRTSSSAPATPSVLDDAPFSRATRRNAWRLSRPDQNPCADT